MVNHLRLNDVEPSIDARTFFSKYISKRAPVIIRGLPDDASFKASRWLKTDMDYLASKAGETKVMVEPMHESTRQYGTDVKRVSMTFKDFLHSLKSEDGPHHYLTTQYALLDDLEPEFIQTEIPPPVNALGDDFPKVPRIMGNLFLQQVNLWAGKSKDGSSSGLHHDYHDNLYCLLQGRKRFVLYPPQEAEHLYPHGKLDTIHPNGVISYSGDTVFPDGLHLRETLQGRVKALERKIKMLREEKSQGKTIDINEAKELQSAFEDAFNELIATSLSEEDGFPLTGEGVDDYDKLMAALGDDDEGESNREEDEEDEEQEREDEDEEGDGFAFGDGDGDEDEDELDGNLNQFSRYDDSPFTPSSFSRIPPAILHQHLNLPTTALPPPAASADEFADLKKTTAPFIVELNAGETLYLPASWWHEVTSTSGDGDGVHMAFNYWFYPPDKLDRFEDPYENTLVWEYFRAINHTPAPPADTAEESSKRKRDSLGAPSTKKAKR